MSARDDPQLDVDPAAAAAAAAASTAEAIAPDAKAAEAPAIPLSTAEAALVARVVAWHNRHPLARRLGPAEVGGLGHLSLPCELPPARPDGGWRRWLPLRLLWRWRLRPAFDEPGLIPGLSARRIAAFAHRHAGVERTGGEPGWPERVVPLRAGARDAVPRHLMTVAIKRGAGASQRILIGPGPAQPVLGLRQWSRPRLLAAGLLTSLLLGAALGAAWWWRGRPAGAGLAGVAAAAAAPASASHAASATAQAAAPAAVPIPAPEKLAASAPAEAPQAGAAASAEGAAREGVAASQPTAQPTSAPAHAAGPSGEGHAAAAAQAAEVHATSAHAAETHGAPAAAPGASSARSHAAAAVVASASAVAQEPPAPPAEPVASIRPPKPRLKPPAPVRSHALVTAPTWHRAETEGRRTRLLRLLGGQMNSLQLEVLRLPEGEVLALWPLPTQADAEVLARRLQSSGIAMLAVDF